MLIRKLTYSRARAKFLTKVRSGRARHSDEVAVVTDFVDVVSAVHLSESAGGRAIRTGALAAVAAPGFGVGIPSVRPGPVLPRVVVTAVAVIGVTRWKPRPVKI